MFSSTSTVCLAARSAAAAVLLGWEYCASSSRKCMASVFSDCSTKVAHKACEVQRSAGSAVCSAAGTVRAMRDSFINAAWGACQEDRVECSATNSAVIKRTAVWS
jgi:hypothetical protein